MVDCSWVRGWRGAAVGVVAACCVAGTLGAQEPSEEDSGPNVGDVSVEAGFDIASAYYFRGIPQQDKGIITQPWVDIGFSLYEDVDSAISSVGLNIGTWNSLHEDNPGDPWYESDFYAALSFGLPGGLGLTTGFTNLYSPSNGAQFSEELNFEISFDDSDYLGGFALNPTVNFVVETEAGSDGTAKDPGSIVLLGVAPSLTLDTGNEDYPLTLNGGVEVGLNMGDYYQTATGSDSDHTLGYVDFSVGGELPLAFVPKSFGAWAAAATLHVLYLGPSVREIGKRDFLVGGDPWEAYVTAGVSMSY